MKSRFLLKILAVATVLLLSTVTVFADTLPIQDFGGSGDMGYKDGKTSEAQFDQPYGLALDKDGGLIVADTYNNRIRKIKDGNVTTIAGFTDRDDATGYPKGGMLDGDALKARFNHPRCVAVDSKGNIFVTDTGNNLIRKITNGKVYTFAGSDKGTAGYADGTADKAMFNTPSGIAIDSGDNLYVADTLNQVIRKITPKGVVSTLAGKNAAAGGYKDGTAAEALFNEPSDVEMDKNGVLYVLDCGNQLIRKIDKGTVTTYAGTRGTSDPDSGYAPGAYMDGQSNKAQFNFPKALSIAEDGTLFIADTWNHNIRAAKPDGSVTTLAGTGEPGKKDDPLSQSMFNGPMGILYSAGKLYISDTWNHCIRSINIDLNNLPDISDKSELMQGINFAAKSAEPQVWMDKVRVTFKEEKPYSAGGNIYVPLRAVFEKWGAKVTYLDKTGQVEIIKGMYYKLLTPKKDPVIKKGKTMMIDTKTLSEITSFGVDIIPQYNAVLITP